MPKMALLKSPNIGLRGHIGVPSDAVFHAEFKSGLKLALAPIFQELLAIQKSGLGTSL